MPGLWDNGQDRRPNLQNGGRKLASTEQPAASISAMAPPDAVPPLSMLAELPKLELPLSSAAGTELVVEVESNPQHLLNHVSLQRFRLTNNLQAACGVTIRMRLFGQGRFVEQEAKETEQCCQFQRWGDQYVFSFPFRGLTPGTIPIRELRVMVTRPDQPGKATFFELPDQSLSVRISDPASASQTPGIVISGGINLDFSQLRELYGSDIKNLLTLNAQREVEVGQAAVQWQAIRLRFVEEATIEPEGALPTELSLQFPGGVAIDLVKIPAGEFLMGSLPDQGKDDERPAHQVLVSRDFYLSKFTVTQEQYSAAMGNNPAKFPLSPQHPVENVSWEDAQEFCRRVQSHLRNSPAALSNPSVSVEQFSIAHRSRVGVCLSQWRADCVLVRRRSGSVAEPRLVR